jgi:hypothetical protein
MGVLCIYCVSMSAARDQGDNVRALSVAAGHDIPDKRYDPVETGLREKTRSRHTALLSALGQQMAW